MGKFQIRRTHGNIGLFVVVVLIYVALLLLFAWQTLLFVNVLFPDTDLTMKILTVFSVDGMGLIWACLHTFYRFAHPHAKVAVRWGWAITYGLSALLSILYLTFAYILHFQHVTDDTAIKIGVGLSIGALMFNLGMISVFLFWEISTRFPNEDEFELVDSKKQVVAQGEEPGNLSPEFIRSVTPDTYKQYEAQEQQPASTPVQPPVATQPEIDYVKLAQALKAVETQSSPLQSPQLDANQASQAGTNGHNQQ